MSATPHAKFPRNDGGWWRANSTIPMRCVACGERFDDWPTVMHYQPTLDPAGEQDRAHPGWRQAGWLAWWQCPACERNRFEAVPPAKIHAWSRTLGPWHLHSDPAGG